MRKALRILVLLTLLLLLSQICEAKHEIYSKAVPSDKTIYDFFTEILKDSEKCLDMFIDENPALINNSLRLYKKVELVKEESLFYSSKGVKSNVSWVVNPFLSLSNGIKELSSSQHLFLKNLGGKNYSANIRAEFALMKMENAAYEIEDSVKEIDKIILWNETTKLKFDTSNLKEKLHRVLSLITYYNRTINRTEWEGIFVSISNKNPFLYQEVKIYVIARNVTPIDLVIDNSKIILNAEVLNHTFSELGKHTIYAEGLRDGRIVRSNVVEINVTKIPTRIILNSKSVEFINRRVRVNGNLMDYYGNFVNAKVRIKEDSKSFYLYTKNGFFSFNLTKANEGYVNVSAYYLGNETYKSSNASISIFFSRYHISIRLETNKKRVRINESAPFTCKILGTNESLPIYIFANSKKLEIINASKSFNFKLNFQNRGRFLVFAYFPGNERYREAKSNEVEIEVISGLINEEVVTLILLFSIVLLPSLIYLIKNKKPLKKIREGKMETVKSKEESEIVKAEKKEIDIPRDVRGAYKLLFNDLTKRFNLKKSLTPRELLESLKDEPFAKSLERITELHEKAVYSKAELSEDEKEVYFELIRKILNLSDFDV